MIKNLIIIGLFTIVVTQTDIGITDVFNYVEDYVTSSGLSLRISKQKLMSGSLEISKEDTIKINISTPVYVKNETKKTYQDLMRK